MKIEEGAHFNNSVEQSARLFMADQLHIVVSRSE
jgi:hypothetical protein